MTERELIISRVGPVARRLKDIGVTVPEMPEGEGNEFSRCGTCRETGNQSVGKDGSRILCPDCFGSGQLVTNNLLDWQQKIQRLWQETMRRGSKGNI